MQALTCRSSAAAAAARRCVPPQAKRPLPSLLGAVATPLAVAAPGTLLHASAPALGGGTPGEWNNVHQWKTRAKLAAMKEAADKAAKAAGAKKDGGEGAAKAMPGKEGTIAALPGEKVLVLDENLPDGALEEYFAGLRSARGGQGEGGAGTGAAGAAGAEGGAAGKPKRKTIKVGFGFAGGSVKRLCGMLLTLTRRENSHR